MREASVKDAVDQFRKKKNGQVVLVLQGGGALGASKSACTKPCMKLELNPIG